MLKSIRCLWPQGHRGHNFCRGSFLPRTFGDLWGTKCVLSSTKDDFFEDTKKGRSSCRSTITFYICISHHLQFAWSVNIFHGSKVVLVVQIKQTHSHQSGTMAVEISLGAQNSSSEASDTFSLLEVSEVCCMFSCGAYLVLKLRFMGVFEDT